MCQREKKKKKPDKERHTDRQGAFLQLLWAFKPHSIHESDFLIQTHPLNKHNNSYYNWKKKKRKRRKKK